MKGFSDQEREIIRQKLFDSCEECWSKYGYKRTNIRELCDMAGISTGAFYIFFPSKEHLFFETAQSVGDRIGASIFANIPKKPSKHDLARALKKTYADMEKVVWYVTLESELALIARKLPQGYLESSMNKDAGDMSKIIKAYHLRPKIKMGTILTTLTIMSMSLINKKLVGKGFDEAFDFMLDSVIDRMFE